MTPKTKRWLPLLKWFLLSLLGSAIVGFCSFVYIMLNAWTIVGSTTGVYYDATSVSQSLEPFKDALAAVAKANGLKLHPRKKGDARDYFQNWENKTGLFGDKQYELTLSYQAHPADEPDSRKRKIYFGVSTSDASKSNEWQKVAKDVERAVAQLVMINSVKVDLEAEIYGFCASEEKPADVIYFCQLPVTYPVDFARLNATELEPRALAHKATKK